MKNKSFIKSLKCASYGIIRALIEERNMRIEFSIANLIVIFAYFFKISSIGWAILVLTIAHVLSAEYINTAIENAVDTATTEIKDTAKMAKDTAAANVLIASIAAVVIGFILFFDITRICDTLTKIFTNPKVLIPCLIVGILDVAFIIWGDRINIKSERTKK